MSYTNGGIFHEGGEGMPSPLVAARSQYPSRFHGSTFFQPQSVPVYRENPMYVPGLGTSPDGLGGDASMSGCGCGGFKSMTGVGWYDINRADSFGDLVGNPPDTTAVVAGAALTCGLYWGAIGAIGGALVGHYMKKKPSTSALVGGTVLGLGSAALCAMTTYATVKVGEQITTAAKQAGTAAGQEAVNTAAQTAADILKQGQSTTPGMP